MDEIQKAMTSNRGYDWKPSKNFKDERLTDSEIGLQVALCLMDYRNDKIDETEVRITNNILSISIQHNDRMGRNVMESVKDANDFNRLFPSGHSRPCIGYPTGTIDMSQLTYKEAHR